VSWSFAELNESCGWGIGEEGGCREGRTIRGQMHLEKGSMVGSVG
jgi:hypothetical protein